MANCTDNLGPALQAFLDAAEAGLVDCGLPVGLVSLQPGNSAIWDNCCEGPEGGQLWVRLISIVPQPVASQACDIDSNQIRIGVGVIRCQHGLTDEGFPTADEMTNDVLATTADAVTLQNAIRCMTLPAGVAPKTLRFEQGTPLGQTGNCGGFEWTISFKLGLCGGCS